jgi:hypothetical protein
MGVISSSEREQIPPVVTDSGAMELIPRFARRFSVLYLGLYCLASQAFSGSLFAIDLDCPTLGTLWMRHAGR